MPRIRFQSLFSLFLLAPLSLFAQDANPQDAELTKMRSVLRDYMTQARDAQNQVVTLQAQTAQDDKDKADLQAKLDALSAQLKTVSDQAVADKADATKQITDLKAQVDDQTSQIGRLNDALKQWKDAYTQAAQLAAVNDAARKQYAMQAAILQRTVDDRETRNLALYQLANEILTRYEKFGLGEALEAKEPFTGLTRIRLEALVQDYKDKILDHAVTSGQGVAEPPPPSAAPLPSHAPTAAPGARPVDPASADRTASARVTNAP